VAFAAGLAVIGAALCSAVGVYEATLFWVHMIQHLLLIMVAPVLLVVGRPLMLAMHATRNPWHTRLKRLLRSRPAAVVTCPLVAVPLYAAAVVGTHLTGFMNSVVAGGAARTGEHVLYLVAGWLYLLPSFGREPVRWRLSALTKVVVILLVMPIDTFTGIALLMTRQPPWAAYADQHRGWGPAPLTDVHWGGAVMWIGGDAIMFGLMMLVFLLWSMDERAAISGRGWFESARKASLASLIASHQPAGAAAEPSLASPGPQGSPQARRADRGGVDDDEHLAAYNAYLARIHEGQPGGRDR
jgi:putative copper resistance protein D